jgi:tetrathionate reductase subunit B
MNIWMSHKFTLNQRPLCFICTEKAITRRADGLILIEPEKCNGCKACLEACPYHAIYFNDELKLAQKCTGCAHLLDNGYKTPRCVEVCPTDAMTFGTVEDLKDLIAGATVLSPETGCHPRVYYRNIPGKFIAGCVYDPLEKEVIIGARCLLTSGGKIMETFTDAYGDFWFKDLPIGTYSLAIEARGFKSTYFSELKTEKDVNLGDVGMERKEG